MKYLLLLAVLACGVFSQDHSDVVEEVTRKVNLEQRSFVDVTSEVKFKPIVSSKFFYHIVPREYEPYIMTVVAKKLGSSD